MVTEDPTLLAANTALNDANVALVQAKQERDAAKKKWIDAGQPQAGYFQRQLDDAQSAVTDAQSTVNKLLLAAAGNGSNLSGRAEKQITRIVRQLSMEDVQKFTAKHADLIDAHLNHRLANPYVNRATLDEDDATLVIVSDYVRQRLLAKQTAGDLEQTLAVYKTQAQVSGSRAGVGKLFEELAFHYLTRVDGEVMSRRLVNDEEEEEEEKKLCVCPEEAEVGTVTTFTCQAGLERPLEIISKKQKNTIFTRKNERGCEEGAPFLQKVTPFSY